MFRLLGVVALTASFLFGQGTDLGTIRGVITDPTGATVPTATVVITDLSTNATVTVKTNNAGEYEAPNLKSGDYKLSVSAAGFRPVEITSVSLRTGTIARADARLEVAHAGETVSVQAEA